MNEKYRAKIDFELGGVKGKAGDIVPCHRDPWSILLGYGGMYVEVVEPWAVSLPVGEQP